MGCAKAGGAWRVSQQTGNARRSAARAWLGLARQGARDRRQSSSQTNRAAIEDADGGATRIVANYDAGRARCRQRPLMSVVDDAAELGHRL
jgi:hypothetical protein